MNTEEYGELSEDLAAVTDPAPATGEFGPVLYGLVDRSDDATEDDGYRRPADEDPVPPTPHAGDEEI